MIKFTKTLIASLCVLVCLFYLCDLAFRKFWVINYNSSTAVKDALLKEDKQSRFIVLEINNILKHDLPIVFASYFKDKNAVKILQTKYAQDHLDAIRHTYVSARLASIYPAPLVRFLGEVNELRYGAANDIDDMNMDLWNNEMGIQIGLKHKGGSKNAIMKDIFECVKKDEASSPSLCITQKEHANHHTATKSQWFNYIFDDVFKKYNIVFEI